MQTEEMNIITLLSDFQHSATGRDFKRIFGDDLGEHLHRKYKKLDENLLALWRQLDNRNRALLIFASQGGQ